MFEVVRNGVVLFRNSSLDRCKRFVARHNLKNATIQPMAQMLAA